MTRKQKRECLDALMSQPADWIARSLANPTAYMSQINLALHRVALRRKGWNK